MRKVVLYIASSLDGYIAGPDHELNWLFHGTGEEYGYDELMSRIDTTLMGRITFEQILSMEVSFPYIGLKNFVFTSNEGLSHEHCEMVNVSPSAFVNKLKALQGKDIWLIGGSKLNAELIQSGLVDELILAVHPLTLGAGVPLLNGTYQITRFNLINMKKFDSGMLMLTYRLN